ncbi:MAG: VWA domain-containing protein [Thermoanaerobaculia bacterium]
MKLIPAILTLLVAAISQAQTPPSSLPGVFSEVLDVRVVNLEVVVTDRDGVPVFGLGPDAFDLRVDGETVPVEYFSEIRTGVVGTETGEDPVVPGLPDLTAGQPVGTSYLVFIDEYFSIARDRDRVLEAVKSDLPLLGPEDRMAVVAFNGSELEMISTWSQSVPQLERAIDAALERPAFGLQRLAEQRQFAYDRALGALSSIRAGDISTDRFLRTQLDPDERFYLERLTDQVSRSVTAGASTLRSFAEPPGRKVMLLLSGGWPFFPATFLGPDVAPTVLSWELNDGQALFRPLTDTANLIGYTLYPVDVPGFNDLLANDSTIVREQRVEELARTGIRGQDAFLRQQEVHYTLNFLAEQTGGVSFLDGARLDALSGAASDTRSYYWIGFSPAREWDDQRHKIEVSLREKGFRVRSRAGFLDSSRQHEVAMALESTLQFGNPAGQGSLRVNLGESKNKGRRKMEVPITIVIPLDEITFLPSEQGEVAQIELMVAVRDDSGNRADIPVVPLAFQAQGSGSPGSFGSYEFSLKLRRQHNDAVIAVVDTASGRILSASVEIEPQAAGAASEAN